MRYEIKDLLGEILAEMTDNGQDMRGLPHTREEVVCWLRDRERRPEAELLQSAEPFRLSGTDDGFVWLLTGGGFAQKEKLVDLKIDD